MATGTINTERSTFQIDTFNKTATVGKYDYVQKCPDLFNQKEFDSYHKWYMWAICIGPMKIQWKYQGVGQHFETEVSKLNIINI